MKIDKLLCESRTLIMGILNVTPDSFWDGGKWNSIDFALRRCEEMAEEGADIIDIGAESTRPGAKPVSAAEEQARLAPLLEKLRSRVTLPLSIDTYKSATAQMAAECGIDILNDICGLQYAPEPSAMAGIAAKYRLPVVVTHNRSDKNYDEDVIVAIKKFFRKSISIATQAGLPKEKIILDPGIGFGKDTPTNLAVLKRLRELTELDGNRYPLLLGVSRKSFIGESLHLAPENRLEATGAACLWGVMSGVKILRVHDVAAVVRMCRMWEAIKGA